MLPNVPPWAAAGMGVSRAAHARFGGSRRRTTSAIKVTHTAPASWDKGAKRVFGVNLWRRYNRTVRATDHGVATATLGACASGWADAASSVLGGSLAGFQSSLAGTYDVSALAGLDGAAMLLKDSVAGLGSSVAATFDMSALTGLGASSVLGGSLAGFQRSLAGTYDVFARRSQCLPFDGLARGLLVPMEPRVRDIKPVTTLSVGVMPTVPAAMRLPRVAGLDRARPRVGRCRSVIEPPLAITRDGLDYLRMHPGVVAYLTLGAVAVASIVSTVVSSSWLPAADRLGLWAAVFIALWAAHATKRD